MKYLFVIDHFGSGGAQRQMVILAKSLAQKGMKIDFFVYYPEYSFYKSALTEENIVIHSCAKSSRFSLRPIFSLVKLIRNNHYTSILSFLDTPNFYTEMAKTLALSSTPLFISERSCYRDDVKVSLKTKLRESFHRIATSVICNSHYQKEQILKRHSWLEKKVITIRNGVDTEVFKPIGTIQKNKKLLVVARIDQGKNALNLAKSLVLFKAKHGWLPQITWVGREDEAACSKLYIKEVKLFIEVNDLEAHWHWMGECSNVNKLMHKHHALIHPSFFEGFPNAVCEALSSGLPVLISNANDNPYLINNNKNGFLFDPKEPSSITDALTIFFNLSDQQVDECSNNCRNFALKDLSIQTYTDNYITVLNPNR
jgi:glycosyltransferase involved in cell wall biosynthesis